MRVSQLYSAVSDPRTGSSLYSLPFYGEEVVESELDVESRFWVGSESADRQQARIEAATGNAQEGTSLCHLRERAMLWGSLHEPAVSRYESVISNEIYNE